MATRRYKKVQLPFDVLAAMLSQRMSSMAPEDLRVIDVGRHLDFGRIKLQDSCWIVVESDQFEEVAEGAEVPEGALT